MAALCCVTASVNELSIRNGSDLLFLSEKEKGKHHIQTNNLQITTHMTRRCITGEKKKKKKKRPLACLERQPCLRRADSQATNLLGCTLNLLAIGERNGPADRPLISQGNVGGIAEINMDYSSMTDSFRRAFCDLPSDLGLALIQRGTF